MRRATLLATLLAATPAAAQEPLRDVAFAWVRGDGAARCPTQHAVMTAVRARLGRDPFREDAAVTAEAAVARAAPRWTATLVLRDPSGAEVLRRALSDASEGCATIADALVESLALALDTAPPPPPPPLPPSPPSPPSLPPPTPAPPRERARTTLSAELLLGALPELAPGVLWRLEVPAGPRWLRVWGGAALSPERRFASPDDAWAFGMTRFAAGACARGAPRRWIDLSGCAGLSFGLVHAVTTRAEPIAPGNYPWAAAVVEGRVALRPAGPFVVELAAGALVAFARNAFVAVGRAVPVYEQSLLVGSFSAGVGIDF